MTETGGRVGALIDRDLVAERLAARAAPLPPRPSLRRSTTAAVADLRSDDGVVAVDVDFTAVDRARVVSGIERRAFVACAAVDAGRLLGHGVDVGVPDAGDLRLAALAARLPATGGITVDGLGVLTVGDVAMRPVAVDTGDGSWAIAVHAVGRLLLTSADGDAFLDAVRDLLEHRDWATP